MVWGLDCMLAWAIGLGSTNSHEAEAWKFTYNNIEKILVQSATLVHILPFIPFLCLPFGACFMSTAPRDLNEFTTKNTANYWDVFFLLATVFLCLPADDLYVQ